MTDGRDLGIRPLGLGDVVDRSVALTRRHFRALFLAMLVVEAPAVALARVESARMNELVGSLGDPERAAAALQPMAGAFAILLAAFLLLQLVATAVTALVVAPSLDPRPRPRLAPSRLAAAVLSATVLQALALGLAPALGMVPGLALVWRADSPAGFVVGTISAAVLAVALFVVAVVRLVLVPVAAAVEGRGPSALLRSLRLMAPPRGVPFTERPAVRASLVLLATFLLVLAVNALAGVPRALAGRFASAPGPLGLPIGPLPLPLELALSLFEALATAALQPFSLVAVVVLYFERRARTEGLDLEIWAERLGERDVIGSALLALVLTSAPGCRAALAEAGRLEGARDLAAVAPGLVTRLERGGAGGPTFALLSAARALAGAAEADGADLGPPARAFRAALARHCELAALPRPAFASAGDRAALDEILARPEFRQARLDPLALRRMLLSAWAWLLERLGTAEAERYASLGRALFLLAGAVAAGLGAAAWLRRRRGRAGREITSGPAVRAAPAPDRSLALAEAALARGETRGAVRHALLAALAALEAAGRVPRGRTLTNTELVRGLAAAGPGGAALAGDLETLARSFDGAVYGGRPVTPAQAGEALAGARRVSARASGGAT